MATACTGTEDAAGRMRPRQAPNPPASRDLALPQFPPNRFPPEGDSGTLSNALFPTCGPFGALPEPIPNLPLPLGAFHPPSASPKVAKSVPDRHRCARRSQTAYPRLDLEDDPVPVHAEIQSIRSLAIHRSTLPPPTICVRVSSLIEQKENTYASNNLRRDS